MSDPMTNLEIEDVLSSIRRLVSEETRLPTRSEARPAPEVVPGKLVLTPALRVVPKEAPPDLPEATEPTGDDAPASVQGLNVLAPGNSAALVAEVLEQAVTHEAAAAVVEATLAIRPDQWEPDGSEMPPAEWAVDWSAEGEPPFASVRGQAPVADDAVSDPSVDADGPAVAPAWPSYEPFFDETAEPSVPLQEPSPAERMTETHPQTLDAGQDPDLGELLDDPAPDYIDAEALRDMIRDILRQELQGPLGERITRNVRKLVRAEIHRALATRDFD
jgi:cell pole-organizing protein PopZ